MHKTNHCFLVGNLGADPVVRVSAENIPIAKFSVAENIQTFDEATKKFKTTHTNWFQVTTFGAMADKVKTGLKKGDRVAIQGRIKTSKYKDKTGEERAGFEIIAENVAHWETVGTPIGSSVERAAGNTPQSTQKNTPHNTEDDLPF